MIGAVRRAYWRLTWRRRKARHLHPGRWGYYVWQPTTDGPQPAKRPTSDERWPS